MAKCNKIGYDSKADARKDIKILKARASGKSMRGADVFKKAAAYQCPFCWQWHITTQPKARAKIIQNKRKMVDKIFNGSWA